LILLSSINFFGSSGVNVPKLLLLLVFPLGGITVAAYLNCFSWKRSLLASVATLVLGTFIAYILLAPSAEFLVGRLLGEFNLLSLSGAFGGLWFIVSYCALVEIFTDSALKFGRWQRLILSLSVSGLLFSIVEYFMMKQFSNYDGNTVWRLIVYSLFLWNIVVITVNWRNET
jgi:hypothetical protein